MLGLALLTLCDAARAQTPVPSNAPPVVRILSPTNGAVFLAPANMEIDASAYGGTDYVTQVQFFANGGLIGSITNPIIPPGALPPIRVLYSLIWSNVPAGDYALTVMAALGGGARGTSAPVNIMVKAGPPPTNLPPVVNLLSPTNDSSFPAPADILIYANATDPDGFVRSVEFFENGSSLGVVTNNPMSGSPVNPFHFLWSAVPAGDYALTAVATDNGGLTSTSPPVNITVTQGPALTNHPPVVVITAPTNGQTFTAPANVLISADVSDPDPNDFGHIISFYAGTNRIGLLVLDPLPGMSNGMVFHLSWPWQNVLAGTYALTVVATDLHGASGTSAPVNITVSAPSNSIPPVVTIVATDPIAVEGTNCCFVPPATVFTNFCRGANTATFLVRRIGDTNGDLTVNYSIGGTASNGVDYATLPGQITIPAGQRFALITIDPLEDVDSTARPYETVVLALTPLATATAPYRVGWPGKAAAIILEECNLPVPVTGALNDNCFRVAWPAANGQNYCLQVSTDLLDWTPVCTNTVVKGSVQFIDPEASDIPNRYYRTVPVAGLPVY